MTASFELEKEESSKDLSCFRKGMKGTWQQSFYRTSATQEYSASCSKKVLSIKDTWKQPLYKTRAAQEYRASKKGFSPSYLFVEYDSSLIGIFWSIPIS